MYGAKRGIAAPGQFTMGDKAGLALASGAGILAAVIADYQQKGEAAALFKINEWVAQMSMLFGLGAVPLYAVILGMVVVGAGSIFYFQPITRQGAFAQGFGLLAVLLTMTPPNLASGLEGFDDSLPGLAGATTREASRTAGDEARIFNAASAPGERNVIRARVIPAQNAREGAKYDLHLRIEFPEGFRGDLPVMVRRGNIRGRVHNAATDETFNLFRFGDGGTVRQEGNVLIIHAGIPARHRQAEIWVRVECVGYEIIQESKVATLGEPFEWTLVKEPSTVPLFIQRLNESYWF